MNTFEPELGQMLFSNSQSFRYPIEPYVETGLDALGDLVSKGRGEDNPCANVAAEFTNDVFQMRSYCWCDGEQHTEGCPPNFVCGDFAVSWYKHSHRSASMSRQVTFDEWRDIFFKCTDSLRSS